MLNIPRGYCNVLLLNVDDIIVTENYKTEKEGFRDYLAREFEIKKLDKLKYFLGIVVASSKK